ncbi:DUF2917 domain-containing protein [Verrucomicrobiota bacterium sgz303538]
MRVSLDSAAESFPVHANTSTPSVSMDTEESLDRAIQLPKGSVYSCQLDAGKSVELRGLEGTCWVTLEGDSNDYVLESGSGVTLTGPGLLVTEGLSHIATINVSLSEPEALSSETTRELSTRHRSSCQTREALQD